MREKTPTRALQRRSMVWALLATVAFMAARSLLASDADLAGDWFLCGSDLQGNHTWDGNLVLSDSGAVTGGSINSSEGPTYSIVGGSLSIDETGRVTGSIQDSDGVTTQLTMHMAPTKGLVAGEGNAAGEDGVFMLVRKATGFLAVDLAGDWFLCGSDIPGHHTWDGDLVLSSSGAVTGGSLNSSEGPTYSIVGGSLSIDGTGRVTGSIQENGVTTQLTMHMAPTKGLVAGEGNAVGGDECGVFVLVRKATGFLAADLAGDWFLCGSDLQGNHTWDGNLVLSSAGAVSGGSINSSEGPTYSIVGGSLSIDETGRVTGSIQDSDDVTTQFTMHMAPGKGLVAGEGNAAGEDGIFMLVRQASCGPASIAHIAIDRLAQRVDLSMEDLCPGSTYTIQRAFTLQPNDWLDLDTFEATNSEMTWFESLSPDWDRAFWRVNNE